MSEWKELKKEFYGSNTCAITQWGTIDFSPESKDEVVGGDKLTYDEYLEVMKNSGKESRHYFEMVYRNCGIEFKGRIEKKNHRNICFERIYVSGMYMDGVCFDGKEEHVWMSSSGFENYKVGDSVSFFADVYRYLKTGNGKRIDFGLRNPEEIKRIDEYELPSDEYLVAQVMSDVMCETCIFTEKCDRVYCMLPKMH